MLNREIYQKDPSRIQLLNDGVSKVDEDNSREKLNVLRFELESFVCEGQYKKGIEQILETFISNVNQPTQPGVWVSGFFGSGKSHLVKMLRYLWEDTKFLDGASARGIANLPESIHVLFKELSVVAKQNGGLRAASGTLGSAGRESVRLSILYFLFPSLGIPRNYHTARFFLWMKSEGILETVREKLGKDNFIEQIDNFFVNEGLHKILVELRPNLYPSVSICSTSLQATYPNVTEISNYEMVKIMKEALMVDKKLPLTLIVMDEVQQFIGENTDRNIRIQEVVEECSKSFDGKLIFVGTGQTAITGTALLKKLEGRFTVRIELSDQDVDSVIRKVILAKKPEVLVDLQALLTKHQGEISRHLSNSSIQHKPEDNNSFAADYPILPVRKKFWELALRNLDITGTETQLRNQLSMVHKAVKTNLDMPLGTILPTDFLFFQALEKMIQTRVIPKTVYNKVKVLQNGIGEDKILASAIGIIFLIGKINQNSIHQKHSGLVANVDSIVDLILTDLTINSSELRGLLPKLLEETKEIVMKVGDEYRIQTEESNAWNDEFNSQLATLNSEPHRIENERFDSLKKRFTDLVKISSLLQGNSKTPRDVHVVHGNTLPQDHKSKLTLYIQNGWVTDENSLLAEARKQGSDCPTIFVFIPKLNSDSIRTKLMEFKAAQATLDKKGVPESTEGKEARASMETTLKNAEASLKQYLDECIRGARVFQSGGAEVLESSSLSENIHSGLQKSLIRLYPEFTPSDDPKWSGVYADAAKGSSDALKHIGYGGDVQTQEVCKKILSFIGSDTKGDKIRNNFSSSPYGWTQDCVDASLLVLRSSGLIKIMLENKEINFQNFERKQITKYRFKVENNPPTTSMRMEIRSLFSVEGVNARANEEAGKIQEFIQKCRDWHTKSGGEKPCPERIPFPLFQDLDSAGENEKLHILYNNRDEIKKKLIEWKNSAGLIEKKSKEWVVVSELKTYSASLPNSAQIHKTLDYIYENRQLLIDSDPFPSYAKEMTEELRRELMVVQEVFTKHWEEGNEKLELDPNFSKLSPEQKHSLREPEGLVGDQKVAFDLSSTESILKILRSTNLSAWKDKVQALPSRFQRILLEAAKFFEPKTRRVNLPQMTLKTEEDVDAYLKTISEILKTEIRTSPILIQ